MRRLGVFFLCFLFIFNAAFVLSHCTAEASQLSKNSSSYKNYIKGLLLDELGEYKQARQAYKEAAKGDFWSWSIHYHLALDYIRLKDFKNAEKECKIVLKLRPEHEKIRFLLSLVYSYRLKYKSAINEYNRLLEKPLLELDETDIRSSLAQLYVMQNDLAKAEEQYKTILADDPDDSYTHFQLGYIYTEALKTNSAIDEFKRAIELQPQNHYALNSLSYLYAELGENLDEALVLVNKALEFQPTSGAYLDTLGWIYFKKGEIDKALSYLENASVLTEDAEIFDHLGEVYFQLGKFEEARKNWKKSLTLQPSRKEIKEKIKKLNNKH